MAKRPNKKDFKVLKDILKEEIENQEEKIKNLKEPTLEETKKLFENRMFEYQDKHKEMAKQVEKIYAEKNYKLTQKERIAILEIMNIVDECKLDIEAKAIEKLIQDVKNIKKCFYMIYIILTLLALLGFTLALKSR